MFLKKLLVLASIFGLASCVSVQKINENITQTFPLKYVTQDFNNKTPANKAKVYDKDIGFLSAEFESGNSNSGSIGISKNKKGKYVYAYGTHQICFENIKKFIDFSSKNKDFNYISKSLNQAGGYKAGVSGKKEFRTAWIKLSKQDNQKFRQAQDEFIYADYLKPRFKELKQKMPKLDFNSMHPIIVECLISTMIQHRDYVYVIKEAVNDDYDNLNSKEFIVRLYKTRKNHVGNSEMLRQRYLKEAKTAIYYLNQKQVSENYNKSKQKIFPVS